MAKKLAVINQLRPRIISQGVADTETISKRMSKNTTYNPDELFGMMRLFIKEILSYNPSRLPDTRFLLSLRLETDCLCQTRSALAQV